MSGLKILYIGSLKENTNSADRCATLSQLGNTVVGIDADYFIHQSVFEKINYRTTLSPGGIKINRAVKKQIENQQWDIIWVDNKPYLTKKTLLYIKAKQPQAKLINLVTDDAFGVFKRKWKLLHNTIKYYDWHFVQRPENVDEYKKYGANNVDFCFRSFNPNFHRPYKFNENEEKKYKTQVGFIGTYENEREEYVAHLISNGINVKVSGDAWQDKKHWNMIQPNYVGESVYGDEYIKRINGMDICLHFLRKGNRDSQDSRTFEIPACKVFMLAQRSHLHEQFFEENKEAVFFDTKEELLEKVKYYLQHTEERKAIAIAGYNKCFSAGFTHRDRLIDVLKKIMN
jgi:spore maturation protein CgeB